jgi:hypothetical protein
MTSKEQHMDMVARTGCVICREWYNGIYTPAEVHHVAEGSSKRNDYATAGLCEAHHRGAIGIHGLGVKKFLAFWNLSSEYELLALVNKWRE